MPLPKDVAAELRARRLEVREDEPLAKKTWWRVGGLADGYVEISDTAGLQALQQIASRRGVPVLVIGNASNLLVSDEGVRGVVVRLVGELTGSLREPSGLLKVGGGLKLISLLRRAERQGWTGLEMLAGVPGTVGGAVRMNAGTRLGEVSDRLVDVGVVLRDGSLKVLTNEELRMSYRSSHLPEGSIVAWARLRLTDADPEESARLVAEHLDYRARTQPVDVPTCGSTFTNPPGDSAGRLIEAAGLKGHQLGRAQVSEKHANFIVNLGGATAYDIRRLIVHVQHEVWDAHGVELEPEVQFVGDWSMWDPEATL